MRGSGEYSDADTAGPMIVRAESSYYNPAPSTSACRDAPVPMTLIHVAWRHWLSTVPSSLCQILLVLLWVFPPAVAAQALIVANGGDRIPVAANARYYQDLSGTLSINDVRAAEFAGNFLPSASDPLHFGLTRSVYWIAFELDWTGVEHGNHRILELGPPKHVPGLTRGVSELWVLDSEGNVSLHERLGTYEQGREIRTLSAGFALQVDAALGNRYLLRVDTARPLILPITLWQESAFHASSQNRNITMGVLYGILLAMAIYNLFLFFVIQERSFLYYVLAIGTQIAFTYLDTKHLRFALNDMASVNLFINLAQRLVHPALLITFLLFQRALLKVGDYNPSADRVIRSVILVGVGVAALALLPGEKPFQFVYVAALAVTIPLALYVNVDAIRHGVLAGIVHLAASAIFLLGATILILHQLWPAFPDNYLTTHAYSVGLVAQAMLLSFGLAFRYNQIKREKEDAQQMAIQNLIRSEQIKDDLLANVSHELRIPLYGINGLAEATLREFRQGRGDADLIIKNLEMIQASGDRLTKLVNDLLDFSSFRDNTSYIKMRPLDLNSLISLVMSMSQPLVGEKQISLREEVEDNLPLVEGDEDRLHQVLLNLVSNAIKFTYVGEVVVSARRGPDNQVTVAVHDTGIGIHKRDQETVFRTFEKLSSPSVHGTGVGLGLPIAKRMVEMHGSQLVLESDLDQGSTFSFTLRVARNQTRSPQTPALKRQMIRRADFSSPTGFKPSLKLRSEQETTILIVDDDEINLTLMAQQLDEYTVITCNNGPDAIARVATEKPDLVLLDLMMPGMNGYEVCQKLRQRHDQIDLPIILVTAKNHLEDLTLGFNTGANDYLAKPYYFEELRSRVENQLKLVHLYRIHEDNVRLRTQIEKYVAAEAELRSTSHRLEQVLDAIETGLIAFDSTGKIFRINQPAAELLELDRHQIIGNRLDRLLTTADVNQPLRDLLTHWDAGDLATNDALSPVHCTVEFQMPSSPSRPETKAARTLNCRLDLFMLEDGMGVLFLDQRGAAGGKVRDRTDSVELITVLGQAQHTIRRIGNRLSALTPEEVTEHPQLLDRLAELDGLLAFIDTHMPEISTEGEYRQQLVNLMRAALHTWEMTTQKTKIELAEESNIWAVSIDDRRLRTRTFDRYLRLELLPRVPRWREVVRTAYFVLSNPAIEPETRASLEAELERTKAILKRAAIQ